MIALYLVLIVFLILCCAFFSSADMVYSSVSRLRLEKVAAHNPSAKLALSLLKNYDKTIASILFGNDLASIIAPSIGTLLAYLLFPNLSYNTLLVSSILIVLILIFGEILPKSFGRTYSYRLSLIYARPVYVVCIIFGPTAFLAGKFASLFSKNVQKVDDVLEDEEVQSMIDEIEEEGVIDEDQSELLHNSIEFKDTTAEEIMTPRVSLVGFDIRNDLNQFVKQTEHLKHSRILVYRKNFDSILGYIPTKSLLKAMLGHENLVAEKLMLPVNNVPSTMEISAILKQMKKSHHHIAIVKDEYGGTAGILTLEDILEELVGELYDESESVQEEVIEGKKKNEFIVLGKMNIDDFFDRFQLDDERLDEDYNTVSGWVNDKLGRFGKKGDKFSYEKIDLVVTKATEFTIVEVKVNFHPRRKN